MSRKRVLFVCTHNAARSQMAQGFLRAMAGHEFEAASAGVDPTQVHPLAVQVMAEIGIDLTQQIAKHVDTLLNQPWDFIVTVCDNARESCPLFPASACWLHWSFDDPSKAAGSAEERLQAFRRIRDEMCDRLRVWVAQVS